MAVTVEHRTECIWEPQEGPQRALLECPVMDVFYGGARFGGKSDAIIGDWLNHSRRYGENCRGVVFRKTYDQLEELQARMEEIYPHLGARYKTSSPTRTWFMHNGSRLKMRVMDTERDAGKYIGHQYTWQAFEEMTEWANCVGHDRLLACLRSPHGIPVKRRGTGNPGGIGHNWVKFRYIDPAPQGFKIFQQTVKMPDGSEAKIPTTFIPAKTEDNQLGVEADPEYWQRVAMATADSPALLKAWRWGIWDIVAGGMFDDLWMQYRDRIVVKPFEIPSSWRIFRSFDWGKSKPFSVGWWAVSDGTRVNGHEWARGTAVRIGEWYGWNGKPNQGLNMDSGDIGTGIVEREIEMGIRKRVGAGPADSSIFDIYDGRSIYADMAKAGATFYAADKSPGSRKVRWEELRKRMAAHKDRPMERPGLVVFEGCSHFQRTVPNAPRDVKKPDDIDTEYEDHVLDETGYALLGLMPGKKAKLVGV